MREELQETLACLATPEKLEKTHEVDNMILGLHGALAERSTNCSSQFSETWIAANPGGAAHATSARFAPKTVKCFFQDSRNLKDSDPPSCQVASHVPVVQSVSVLPGRPFLKTLLAAPFLFRHFQTLPQGTFEAVASDSERASGGAKVPRQRRPIDLKGFFFAREASVLRKRSSERPRAKKVAPAQLLNYLHWSLQFLTRSERLQRGAVAQATLAALPRCLTSHKSRT